MKNIFAIWSCILVLTLSSCSRHEESNVPADLIPRDTMMNLVVESWLLESSIHTVITDYNAIEPATIALYADFFDRHHISKDQYIRSTEYYLNDDKTCEQFVQDCRQLLEEKREEFTGVSDPTSQPQ